jgi:hypothetical protein
VLSKEELKGKVLIKKFLWYKMDRVKKRQP